MGALLEQAAGAVRAAHVPLTGRDADYDRLLDRIGDARIVLLGEASHGTHEFYAERARITRRLIEERGFGAVAVEADWPDAWRVGRYVRLQGSDAGPEDALGGFDRFPRWMWRNHVVRDFVSWLRAWNGEQDTPQRVHFVGVDLYSMYESVAAVLRTVEQVAPDALDAARARYACFDHVDREPQAYGLRSLQGMLDSCEQQAIEQVVELRRRALSGGGVDRDDERAEALFDAEQNARLVRDAEAYYRTMYRSDVSSWNVRDRHMAETIDHVARFLERRGGDARVVVWEHNSHLGDARATEMGQRGELNVGQLVRERWGSAAVSVGFTTFRGSVTAAHDWDGPPRHMQVRDGMTGSYERLFHELGLGDFLLLLDDPGVADALEGPLLERAIGVIYRPESERFSHYFRTRLPRQFDAVVHLDETTALEPLDPQPTWRPADEPPETWPTGM